jgi:RNA polymerase subunit RPABC4/transcription elongation factor Spt4
VQHPCSRCGAAVDDSSPFCPTCEAPQITFESREPASEVVRLHPETVPPSPVATPLPERIAYPSRASDRARFLRAAIYAAVIAALISTIRGGVLIAVPLAGILAVRFFRKATFDLIVPPRLGFRLGALSGLLLFGMLVLVSTVNIAAQGGNGELRERTLEMIRQYQAANPDPQAQQIFQYFQTAQGFVVLTLFGMLVTCIVMVVISGLAGLASAAFSQRRSGR